jgi:hypothetical protein
MKTAIIVSSVNRPRILHETVLAINRQTISPTTVILSLCDTTDVLQETAQLPLARVVQGPKGLTKQRNSGLRVLPPETDCVLFLDDDTELAPNYVESMERLFDRRPDIAVASGVCAMDGLRLGRALTREEAMAAVRKHPCRNTLEAAEGAYGCNMFVRRLTLEQIQFDETLPLHGWLEDYDFSIRCKRKGLVVWNCETCVAHMGVQRTSRERGFIVGYSQIANSHYLWRKGVIPSAGKLLGGFWLPALCVNLHGAVRGKPPWSNSLDYKGRVLGNARALADAALHKLAPARIADFI